MAHSKSKLLSVARGDTRADLVLRNGRIVNVFSGDIERADIALVDGYIAGIGADYDGQETIDLDGAFVAPGLIDAHVHIESSLCLPAQFAAAIVPRGVTTVIADPHEIANVAGVAGIRFMADAARNLPLRIVLMAPSCVPATTMATAGATLSAGDLASLLADGTVHGLAEVMNFPGVIDGDQTMLAKIAAFANRPIDGHAPNVRGKSLNAYVAAGVGSDHECTTVEEAREKLARGMYVLIREATNARNLDALLPLITKGNARRICFCTDDRTPPDLMRNDETGGTIDMMLRRAIAFGIDPIDAFRMCTLNAAEWFRLPDRGAIAPGLVADLFVFDDLQRPTARDVFSAGTSVYQAGGLRPGLLPLKTERSLISPMDLDIDPPAFSIRAKSNRIRTIGAVPDQLVTEHLVIEAKLVDGFAVADSDRDILKMLVFDRHAHTGNVGRGFIKGFGLARGAIAGTVAHDHHNLVVIGADDESMRTAARAICAMGGGLVAANGANVLASLALPIAGLMSNQPIDVVRTAYDDLLRAARQSLGSPLHDPFMAMSFMALEVIPKLKLTDQGLVDTEKFEKVALFV